MCQRLKITSEASINFYFAATNHLNYFGNEKATQSYYVSQKVNKQFVVTKRVKLLASSITELEFHSFNLSANARETAVRAEANSCHRLIVEMVLK